MVLQVFEAWKSNVMGNIYNGMVSVTRDLFRYLGLVFILFFHFGIYDMENWCKSMYFLIWSVENMLQS